MLDAQGRVLNTDNTRTTIRRSNGPQRYDNAAGARARRLPTNLCRGAPWHGLGATPERVCSAWRPLRKPSRPSCCTFETATSVLALPYGQAPNPCHPAPSRARRRGTGCCNGSAPPSGELTPSVCASASVHQARRPSPRISAADRPDRRKPTPGGGRLSTALAPAALKCPMCLGLQSSVFAPT